MSRFAAGVVALVTAILEAAVVLGFLDLSAEQQAAIILVATSLLGLFQPEAIPTRLARHPSRETR